MRNYVIALYIRLSVEDFKTESLSIPNQKLILREKAMSLPEWDNSEILEFIDNGHTGTNFERPAVQELLTMVQAGKINCIIVKDLSRFGRNSIETGYFIERVFPLYHTPFSALKACYQRSVADLQAEVAETQKKLGDLLRFLQEAFGKGTELSMAVNDLTVAPVATAFLGQFLSTDYFAASRDLLLHRQSEQLLHQIDLTGLV